MKGAPIPLNPAWKRYDENYCLLVDENTGALLLTDGEVNCFKLYAEQQVDLEYLGPDAEHLNFENFPDAEDWPRKVAIEITQQGNAIIGNTEYVIDYLNETMTPMPPIIQP